MCSPAEYKIRGRVINGCSAVLASRKCIALHSTFTTVQLYDVYQNYSLSIYFQELTLKLDHAKWNHIYIYKLKIITWTFLFKVQPNHQGLFLYFLTSLDKGDPSQSKTVPGVGGSWWCMGPISSLKTGALTIPTLVPRGEDCCRWHGSLTWVETGTPMLSRIVPGAWLCCDWWTDDCCWGGMV